MLGRWVSGVFVLAVTLVAEAAGPLPEVGVFDDGSHGRGFAQVSGPRELEFPRDHGPHPDYRQEWWYVTGNLDGANGERFGFELTFFRVALAPAGSAASGVESGVESGWRTRQMYMAHFAITDVARGRFRFAQKLSRGALGLAGAQVSPLRVWLDDWWLAEMSTRAESSGLVSRGLLDQDRPSETDWTLRAVEPGYELELDARTLLQPVLNGDRGFLRHADEPGLASYYYSIPRIAVHGKLTRDGHAVDVQGLAWLDREWFSAGLSRSEEGWDWFALQLKNGSTFMFYALRNRGGGRNSNSAGTWVAPNGQSRRLSNDQVRIDVLNYWTNAGGERYPAAWRVRAPSLGLDVSVRPVMADQELTTTPRYWEGAVDVTGANGNHAMDGRGYVELVGYASQ